MEKYAIKQLSVFLENRKGELTDATSILYEEQVKIKSLLVLDSTDFGILRLIVEDPDAAKAVLLAAGYTVRVNKVFAVKVEDELGKFYRVSKVLSDHSINILYTYAFREEKAGVFVFKVDNDDFNKAMEVLEAAKFEIVDSSYFY